MVVSHLRVRNAKKNVKLDLGYMSIVSFDLLVKKIFHFAESLDLSIVSV